VRALSILSGALIGLMMILIGAFIPSLIILPTFNIFPDLLALKTTWQLPSLLLCAMLCGPRSALIAAIAYLTIGIFFIPIFNGGGSIGYLLTPEFGFLAGFIPASIITGTVALQTKRNSLIGFTKAASYGVALMQLTGIINIVIGTITSRWSENLSDLLISYSLAPFFSQLLICPAIALISISLNKFLFLK
tara:strand:+ start:1264 stop:1836 length:573 start_codon:yes stop_codon:yes gene_type:complete